MVGGLEKFREAFADFSDNFVIIGGTACDEVLAGTAMRPRPTLDIDIIVIVENMTADFANAFWQFITAGGYRPGVRKNDDNTPKYVLYSFDNGAVGYPVKIELLSRHNEIFTNAAHTNHCRLTARFRVCQLSFSMNHITDDCQQFICEQWIEVCLSRSVGRIESPCLSESACRKRKRASCQHQRYSETP